MVSNPMIPTTHAAGGDQPSSICGKGGGQQQALSGRCTPCAGNHSGRATCNTPVNRVMLPSGGCVPLGSGTHPPLGVRTSSHRHPPTLLAAHRPWRDAARRGTCPGSRRPGRRVRRRPVPAIWPVQILKKQCWHVVFNRVRGFLQAVSAYSATSNTANLPTARTRRTAVLSQSADGEGASV